MSSHTAIDADVLVVGAGVVGCAIARRLSMQNIRVVVVERRHDVGCGSASANSGIAGSGWTLPNGSLEAKLTVASNPRWEEVCDQLCVTYKRCGSVILARSDEEVALIPAKLKQAKANGVPLRRLDSDEVRRIAPHATPEALAGIHVACEGILDSPRLTIGYAELAELNGVKFFFCEPVIGARRDGDRIVEVRTPHLRISPKFIVNAAGLGADIVSRMLGCEDFRMTPRRGEYLVLDREFGRRVPCPLHPMPTPTSHGLMIIPTAHGGVLVGPTADDIEEKTDTSTHNDVLEHVLAEGRRLMPDLDEKFVIKTYAGNRPHSPDGTYRIGPSELASNVIQTAAVRSIGVSMSPALGDYVLDMLVDQGLSAPVRAQSRERLDRPRAVFETLDCECAANDPMGRTIVCACEKVTAAEIHAALQSPLPASSIGGIARRTHATYGRCQGSACGAGVALIASLYRQGEAWEVPVGEPEATLGVGKANHV
jgi:glycerol-3-phosphate dehydrogenase